MHTIRICNLLAAYRIHTSETFKLAIDKTGGYELEHRGTVQVKVGMTMF